MPLPFLIPVALTALGISSHMSAKEKNEKAQETMRHAQSLYDSSQRSLQEHQKTTSASLEQLGRVKTNVFQGCMKDFLSIYRKVMKSNLKGNNSFDEVSNFTIDDQDVLELTEMSNIYESAISSATTATATGVLVSLAIDGSLPLVTGTLSLASTVLSFGEIGTALTLTGSAVSTGLALTPLSAIAAPVVLFTGLSSSFKADENLEKAVQAYSDAEVAVEKMKTASVMCDAIKARSDMYAALLNELNPLLETCVSTLDKRLKRKGITEDNPEENQKKLKNKDIELIAVSRAIAGAIKSVLDAPLLDKDGNLTDASEKTYQTVSSELPSFHNQVKNACSLLPSRNDSSVSQSYGKNQEITSRPKRNFLKYALLSIAIIIFITAIVPNSDSKTLSSNVAIPKSQTEKEDTTKAQVDNNINNEESHTSSTSNDEDYSNLSKYENDSILSYGVVTDTITWIMDNNHHLTISGKGALPDYEIESDIAYETLTNDVSSITVEEGITSIGSRAFANSVVDEISLPSTLETIKEEAFRYSTIKRITIPENVRTIEAKAFADCLSLEEVQFENMNTYFDKSIFDNCNNLLYTNYIFDGLNPEDTNSETNSENNPNISTETSSIIDSGELCPGITWNLHNDMTITVTGTGAIEDYMSWSDLYSLTANNDITSITIEEGITHIGKNSLARIYAETVYLPNSLQTIGNKAFYGSSIKSIIIPENVTYIGSLAFVGCDFLEDVTILNSDVKMEDNTFDYLPPQIHYIN